MFMLLGKILLIMIVLIIVSQIIVIISSVIMTRFRRRRAHLSFGEVNEPLVYIDENNLQIFTYGMDLYHAMLHDIEEAKESICLESFIWKGDTIGHSFKDALTKKADAGVPVYIILDGFANLVVPRSFKVFSNKIHVLIYRSWRGLFDVFDPRHWSRDHRKVLIIDRKIGYTGGYNIGDLYGEKWRDTHIRAEGTIAQNLYASFTNFWNSHSGKRSFALDPAPASIIPHIRLYENNPAQLTFPIRSLYIDAIDLAKSHVFLTTPYFIPDRYVLHSLLRAASRGVSVQLLIPERSNHLLADWLARTFFTRCLKQGVRVFLYQRSMIHAKTATIDGEWTTIGTANLDRLSLVGNYEINVEFLDQQMASSMESIFQNDLTYCKELRLADWVHRPLAQKMGELILSPLWPFL